MINFNAPFYKTILAFIFCLFVCSSPSQAQEDKFIFDFKKGETITYDVKKFGIKIGETKVIYHGKRNIDNIATELIVIDSDIASFKGEDRIYLNEKTLLPYVVKRDIVFFGKNEKIIEQYDQENGVVRIEKTVNDKTTTQVIEKKGTIENVHGFIFRYRKSGSFRLGEEIRMGLPLVDVDFKLIDQREIKVLGEKRTAFYMKGRPRKLKIWLDTSQHHVPLRIDGNMGVGKVVMILSHYENQSEVSF